MDKDVVGTAITGAFDALTGIKDPDIDNQIQAVVDMVDLAGGVGGLADQAGLALKDAAESVVEYAKDVVRGLVNQGL